jgi:Flp pilus assembly protein TadG
MRRNVLIARSRQRGAVLVEAVVVVPVFILLLGGMLFLHHVLREQQRVMQRARTAAWTYAMSSCSGGGNGVPQPGFSSTMAGAPGSDLTLQDNLGSANSADRSSVTVSDTGVFSFSQAVSSHSVVFCNNQTDKGDIAGVFGWLVQNAQGLFFGGT